MIKIALTRDEDLARNELNASIEREYLKTSKCTILIRRHEVFYTNTFRILVFDRKLRAKRVLRYIYIYTAD